MTTFDLFLLDDIYSMALTYNHNHLLTYQLFTMCLKVWTASAKQFCCCEYSCLHMNKYTIHNFTSFIPLNFLFKTHFIKLFKNFLPLLLQTLCAIICTFRSSSHELFFTCPYLLSHSAKSLNYISRISPQKRKYLQSHFSLLIRGPGGFDSWKNPQTLVTPPL